MNTMLTPDMNEVMEAVHYRPAISIILPFEPKMSAKALLTLSLAAAVKKVEKELEENYPAEMVLLMKQKLHTIIQHLNFNTHKKSIAIYVSPVFEKVLYLDIAVEEKIMVDESFEIRDLVYSKKQLHKYLVLLLDGRESRIFLGNADSFVRIVSNTARPVFAYVNDIPQKVANFSDKEARRELMMDKFLHYIDNGLDIILNAYHLPLFIIGPEKMLGHFNAITKHKAAIIDCVYGCYDDASDKKIAEILAPYIADWKKVMQKDLLNQLDDAAGKKKLVTGMADVWREAGSGKGRLLVVEKDYMYEAARGGGKNSIIPVAGNLNKFSCIRDAVDDVIEKVLDSGGDVEFADNHLLDKYQQIALIKYY